MGRLTTADGRALAYRRSGDGPILVCHPGGPGFSAGELADLAGLDDALTLLLLDPRGTGESDRPSDPRAYLTKDYVADLEELRGHLGLERMSLLGHSHGGIVAIAWAAAHPRSVEALILSSTLARFQAEQAAAMEKALAARASEPWYADAREALEAEQAGRFADDDELGELVRREMPFYLARHGARERAFLDSLVGVRVNADALKLFNEEIFLTFDLRGDLAGISAETLVLVGDADFITGPDCARELADGIDGSRLVVIPAAGHLTYVEQPEAFREAVLGFLSAGGSTPP